jgi:hypothetical protein
MFRVTILGVSTEWVMIGKTVTQAECNKGKSTAGSGITKLDVAPSGAPVCTAHYQGLDIGIWGNRQWANYFCSKL